MNIDRNREDEFLKHSCNICGKQMLTKEKLKQHQDEVHKNKGLKCTECDYSVKSKGHLAQHKRKTFEAQLQHSLETNTHKEEIKNTSR